MMDQEINDNEVPFENQSFSLTRPTSAASSDMPKVSLRSQRANLFKRQPTTIDVNGGPLLETKQNPIKVIVVNGKCSQVFKSTLEECVEDCILEYPAEQNSVYVSKPGQAMSIPPGSTRNSMALARELSANARQSAKSTRRPNSTNEHGSRPPTGSARNSATSNIALPSIALVASTSARLRHQLAQQKFSLVEDISEEESFIVRTPSTSMLEAGVNQSEQMSVAPDEPLSPSPNPEITSPSLPPFRAAKQRTSFQQRQRMYRLSDLVMHGPEPFVDVFRLPRRQSQSRSRTDNLSELDRIKQDLFHRYLWIRNPQVLYRICPMSKYTQWTTTVT